MKIDEYRFMEFLNRHMEKNVYRTNDYIVVQKIYLNKVNDKSSVVFSSDTYTRRTKQRDKEFNKYFSDKNHPNGKRIHATLYIRKYED